MSGRPIRTRVWFTKPEWYWFGPRTLIPFLWGGDEFFWHCWELGWTITGRVTFAVRACPQTGRCAAEIAELRAEGVEPIAEWPIDSYGHNHVHCEAPDCHCALDAR